jgi:diguanylate cyclase
MSPARRRNGNTGSRGEPAKSSKLREQHRSLREANEALVRSALDAQTRAECSDRALAELTEAAKLDPLTGLPDRLHLLDRLEHAMARARRNDTRVAVLFIDLDGFKQVNDRLGHAVGDQVLQWAARGITSAVREVDTVSRHGGDEFVIVLDGVGDTEGAAVVANKIIAELGRECRAGEHRVRVSASIGISLFPDHGGDASRLVDQADAPM